MEQYGSRLRSTPAKPEANRPECTHRIGVLTNDMSWTATRDLNRPGTSRVHHVGAAMPPRRPGADLLLQTFGCFHRDLPLSSAPWASIPTQTASVLNLLYPFLPRTCAVPCRISGVLLRRRMGHFNETSGSAAGFVRRCLDHLRDITSVHRN